MYYTYGKEFNKKDNLINIKNKKYKTNNEFEADAIVDSLNALAFPLK